MAGTYIVPQEKQMFLQAKFHHYTHTYAKLPISYVNIILYYTFQNLVLAIVQCDCIFPPQIVWAETYKIGCGSFRCSELRMFDEGDYGAMLLVCNYGPG